MKSRSVLLAIVSIFVLSVAGAGSVFAQIGGPVVVNTTGQCPFGQQWNSVIARCVPGALGQVCTMQGNQQMYYDAAIQRCSPTCPAGQLGYRTARSPLGMPNIGGLCSANVPALATPPQPSCAAPYTVSGGACVLSTCPNGKAPVNGGCETP